MNEKKQNFYNTLSKSEDINVAYRKDHRLEYNELSHKELDIVLQGKPDCKNMVDIACGPAKTLIYFYLNSNANIFGSEIDEGRYLVGKKNLIKLHKYLRKDGIRAKLTKQKKWVILTCSGRTITYCHMSMYDPLIKKKVSEADIIIANVGYFYRMRHKYKDIFENIKVNLDGSSSVKIISYKGPKFVDDQYIISVY